MSNGTPESRHLPAGHARRMLQLEDSPLVLDGRSRRWVEQLQETGFVAAEICNDKKRTTIKVELTEHGKYALERDKRGVDPYLRMT